MSGRTDVETALATRATKLSDYPQRRAKCFEVAQEARGTNRAVKGFFLLALCRGLGSSACSSQRLGRP
jgi:hypothetical protein